ncbi:TPA: putative DNA-binding transcriptional regulator [Enterobacter asburiae]|nr:putative DNA-binding transcriptional regulator [Enterobacter asburiae]
MSKPDWEAIESAYRAGVLSVRELAGKYGISHQAISKRAKKDGWERDLKAKVQAKADALVAKREVARQVATESTISERQLIEATAEVIATVRMEHRSDIRRARTLTNSLLEELESECSDVDALNQLGELLRREDDKGMDKLNDLYHKIISLPGRVKAMKDLADSLKNLIALERQAYSLDDQDAGKQSPIGDKSDDDLTRRIQELMHGKPDAGAKA